MRVRRASTPCWLSASWSSAAVCSRLPRFGPSFDEESRSSSGGSSYPSTETGRRVVRFGFGILRSLLRCLGPLRRCGLRRRLYGLVDLDRPSRSARPDARRIAGTESNQRSEAASKRANVATRSRTVARVRTSVPRPTAASITKNAPQNPIVLRSGNEISAPTPRHSLGPVRRCRRARSIPSSDGTAQAMRRRRQPRRPRGDRGPP